VSASLHNEPWRERLGYRDMAAISPRDAGTALAGLVASHDLTVFETYGTDVAGHRQDMELAATVLTELDAFLGGLADALATDAVVMLASDHGNVEDLSTRRHTANRALAGWRGPLAPPRLEALTDVAPAILHALATPAGGADTVAGGGAFMERPETGAAPAR
jgi:bisphosphoglycerate-independent phosphoglycerate mutase (AlkP superfamily)